MTRRGKQTTRKEDLPRGSGRCVRGRTGGALHLREAHGEHLDEHEGLQGHVDVEAEVRGLLVEHLAGVHPGDAGGLLGEDHANQAEHGPAGVLELALAEAHDVERLVEGLCRSRREVVRREGQRRGIETVGRGSTGERRRRASPEKTDIERDTRRDRFSTQRRKPARRQRARSRRGRARVRALARSDARVDASASRIGRLARARRREMGDARFARRFPARRERRENAIARARDARKPRVC